MVLPGPEKFLYVTRGYRGYECFTIYLKTKENKGKRSGPWSGGSEIKIKNKRKMEIIGKSAKFLEVQV